MATSKNQEAVTTLETLFQTNRSGGSDGDSKALVRVQTDSTAANPAVFISYTYNPLSSSFVAMDYATLQAGADWHTFFGTRSQPIDKVAAQGVADASTVVNMATGCNAL
jgi:hypothetical protein